MFTKFTIPNDSPFFYRWYKHLYKPFGNGWFMTLFVPHYGKPLSKDSWLRNELKKLWSMVDKAPWICLRKFRMVDSSEWKTHVQQIQRYIYS